MKQTRIVEKEKVAPKSAILIEGLPGLGMVGKIATEYLVKQLRARRIAELYSPHFAYYVLVNKKGSVRLLRSVFHYWKNEKDGNELIMLTGDSQPQTVEGQYEVADAILDFAGKKNVKLIITIGGFREEAGDEPQVLVSATSQGLLRKALEAGAKNSPSGNPIVGTAGLLIGLAEFKKMDGVCFLVETPGYLSDPRAAKSVLNILKKMLGFDVDLAGLDKEILRSERIEERMKKIEEERRVSAHRRQKIEEEKVSYIS